MRITTVLRKLIGVTQLFVLGLAFDPQGIILYVRPRWRGPRCGNCGKKAPRYDKRPIRFWRHLALGRTVLWLAYAPRRVSCPRCGVMTEKVPWAPAKSRFTSQLEELTAYLAQVTDKSHVAEILGISWASVDRIVERVVSRRLNPSRLDKLRVIGVDEFSYRKHHRYVTVVVDHDRRQVVWAKEGRSAEVLESFFQTLGLERCHTIQAITMDMAGGYIKAAQDWLPQAEIVFDRFHVQRLASDAVDDVRRALVREAQAPEEAKAIKKTRFVLLKNPWNLSPKEKWKLSGVQVFNKRLYRAYLLKETLGGALDYVQPKRATNALRDWLSWASRSKLEPFVKAARTVRKHFDGIMAYVKTRLTNGLVEGLNNKLRVVARRAYGFHTAGALISMLFLTCGGVQLDPPLPFLHPPER